MSIAILPSLLALFLGIFWLFKRRRSSTLHDIPGPKSKSWLYGRPFASHRYRDVGPDTLAGNILELLLTKEYGEREFEWLKAYGPVYTFKACFGESTFHYFNRKRHSYTPRLLIQETRLMVSDPTAAQYILNAPVFVHGPMEHKTVNLAFGFGNVIVAKGDRHRYLRTIMNPRFSAKSVRETRPILRETSHKLVERWESLGFPGQTVDISRTLHDAALDALGAAILENPFDGLEGKSALSKIQRSLLDSIWDDTELGRLADAILAYVPEFLFRLATKLPLAVMRSMREYHRITDELAHHLLAQNHLHKDSNAFINPFIRGALADAQTGIPDEEIPIHLRSILVAADDTTGSTLGWVLYQLARMPEYQDALRQEIQLATAEGRGEPEYDKMPLLNAVINEVLRLYSALPLTERVATADCILPLSQPVTTTSGHKISEIAIKQGQSLFVSIASYHRLTSIWGADAAEFRPSRWLAGEPCKGTALGPYASLLSFLAGPGVCLGWRFALLELQVFATELVRNFVLSLPEDDSVRARFSLTLVPKTADGAQVLPIHVEHVA
ncbi:cytochrome P450 [Mycena filopes]|nr:cytochrome P450 [Mycena filopes]